MTLVLSTLHSGRPWPNGHVLAATCDGLVQVTVPEVLIAFVMPFLAALEAHVRQLEAQQKANISARAFPKFMREMAVVAVQDSLDLAESFPGNQVHERLLRHPAFRYTLGSSACIYKARHLSLVRLTALRLNSRALSSVRRAHP